MKTKLFLALFVAMGMCLTASIAGAVTVNLDTTAQFDDTSGAGVDLYPGTTGEGWASTWTARTTGSPGYYKTIKDPTDGDYAPFDADNDNYLFTRVTPTTAIAKGAVSRDYSGGLFNPNEDYTISFSFRAEDLSNFAVGSNFNFWSDPANTYNVTTSSTFQIRVVPQSSTDDTRNYQWYCSDGNGDGTNAPDSFWSGVYLVEGHIYDFEVTMHPGDQSWDFSVTDQNFDINAVPATAIANPVATAATTDLGWRNSIHGTKLHFGSRGTVIGEPVSCAIDDIHITQSYSYEPLTQVVANFDGGTSTTVVDAYKGMAGDGWAGPWEDNKFGSQCTLTGTIDSVNEVHSGDGNCLSLTMVNDNTSDDAGGVFSRSYNGMPGLDQSRDQTISFTVRIDETDIDNEFYGTMTDYDDRYVITGSDASHGSTNLADTFVIRAMGDEGIWGPQIVRKWAFADGDNAGGIGAFIGSGIDLVEGGVYDFVVTLNVDDKSYDVSVTDGTETFEATDLGWRTGADEIGGWLNFAMRADALGEDRAMTIDNILIEQDPEEDWIKGDANKDGFVDGSDAALLANNWQATGATWAMGDFTGDGVVDGSDAALLANNWQTGTPPTPSAVPEPSTVIGLLTLLLAGFALARRR